VVGWQMADHMRTSLVIDALEMARIHGHVQRGALFHSDRGTQPLPVKPEPSEMQDLLVPQGTVLWLTQRRAVTV